MDSNSVGETAAYRRGVNIVDVGVIILAGVPCRFVFTDIDIPDARAQAVTGAIANCRIFDAGGQVSQRQQTESTVETAVNVKLERPIAHCRVAVTARAAAPLCTSIAKRPIADGRVGALELVRSASSTRESCTANSHIATAGGVALEGDIAHRCILHASGIGGQRVTAKGNVGSASCVICESTGAHGYIICTGGVAPKRAIAEGVIVRSSRVVLE